MFKHLVSILLFFLFTSADAQKPFISIIPQPDYVQAGQGSFTIDRQTAIVGNLRDTAVLQIAQSLSELINAANGYTLSMKQTATATGVKKQIILQLNKDANHGAEGYSLKVTPNKVEIMAYKPAGLYYGMQTLLQLSPVQVYAANGLQNKAWQMPVVTIIDKPRFGWRGLMLDVARHFFTKDEVKEFIDQMARYKFNVLHLHLSDDQGWRIQINSLPLLTKVGAWRPKREGKWGNAGPQKADEPKDYGGFYTHDDIRELVQYARSKYIDILPEIDIPGHSMAAIAAYPELTCTPGTYRVNAGEEFIDWHSDGTHTTSIDNNVCPAKEVVYIILDSVFTEIAQLFPFKYIHMGGDEAAKNMWEKSDPIKDLMKKEGLKNQEEVQSYFVKRVEKIIESKGKKLMGWDEILEGGLPPDAAVMSWRGMKGGIQAAKQGHHVVMSPSTFAYLDYMQGDAATEAHVYASLRLKKTYQFDPVPAGIDSSMILGGQANLWTEQLPNMRAVEYMIWPRALAIAESVWSTPANKDYNRFVGKVEKEFKRMDLQEVRYATALFEPIVTVNRNGDDLEVILETEAPGLEIYYSFDETNPDKFYPKYSGPLKVPFDAATLKMITYKNGDVAGRQINIPVTDLEKRAGKKG